MADFVFEFPKRNFADVNIHGHAEHFSGTLPWDSSKAQSKFKNIKSRYLGMVRAQLIAANPNDAAFIKALKLSKFEGLEAEFEAALVNNYNSFAASLGAGGFTNLSGALGKAMGKGDAQGMINALSSLIDTFKMNVNAMSLIKAANGEGTMTPIEATFAEVTGVGKLVSYVTSVMNGNRDFDFRTLSNYLTQPSEALAALIDATMEDAADEAVMDVLGKMSQGMIGTRSKDLNYNFKGKQRKVRTKAADVQGQYLSYSEIVNRNGNTGVTVMPNLTFTPYYSVKSYRQRGNPLLEMASYSGWNSLIVDTLHMIYGSSPEIDYVIYNTLAFNSIGTSGALDKNYRIMRSDIIAEMAEKYIIGFSTTRAQQVLIFNYRAYPMLTIISAIADDAASTVASSDRGYGSLSSGDIFSVSFTEAGNPFKVGKNSTRDNPFFKMQRIQEVKAKINGLYSQGRISTKNLFAKLPQLMADPTNGLPTSIPHVDPGSI